MLYMATVLPGLEFVLEQEIQMKCQAVKLDRIERGKIYFHSSSSAQQVVVLRTADNIYVPLHQFQIGTHKIHLNDLKREMAAIDLSMATSNRSGTIHFKVNASRSGKHAYSRFDAADAAMVGIAEANPGFQPDLSGGHEVEFRLDIHHEQAAIAYRLTDAAYRYRGQERQFSLASLRPPIAHALVWLSEPKAEDMFIDPCCGSGTILTERLAYPYARIEGGDINEQSVGVAIDNLKHSGRHKRVRVSRWDARFLPLEDNSVNKVVTNLPFGKQIANDEDIPALYTGIFREFRRVLKRDGQVVCMTDAEDALQYATNQVEFHVEKVATLSLKGLHPSIFRLRHAVARNYF